MQCALTTRDNPYDPFEQFVPWFMFDIEKGYNSCGYLARVSNTSDLLSDEENDIEVERAIDEIIRIDPLNIFQKIKKSENS